MRYALFPLHTVLFPGSRLPLQIFEQRYLGLISDSLKKQQGFVCVLISEGKEVNDTPSVFSTGCYVEITDWETLANGLLGITIEARYRVRLSQPNVKDSGLLVAETEAMDDLTQASDSLLPPRYHIWPIP